RWLLAELASVRPEVRDVQGKVLDVAAERVNDREVRARAALLPADAGLLQAVHERLRVGGGTEGAVGVGETELAARARRVGADAEEAFGRGDARRLVAVRVEGAVEELEDQARDRAVRDVEADAAERLEEVRNRELRAGVDGEGAPLRGRVAGGDDREDAR